MAASPAGGRCSRSMTCRTSRSSRSSASPTGSGLSSPPDARRNRARGRATGHRAEQARPDRHRRRRRVPATQWLTARHRAMTIANSVDSSSRRPRPQQQASASAWRAGPPPSARRRRVLSPFNRRGKHPGWSAQDHRKTIVHAAGDPGRPEPAPGRGRQFSARGGSAAVALHEADRGQTPTKGQRRPGPGFTRPPRPHTRRARRAAAVPGAASPLLWRAATNGFEVPALMRIATARAYDLRLGQETVGDRRRVCLSPPVRHLSTSQHLTARRPASRQADCSRRTSRARALWCPGVGSDGTAPSGGLGRYGVMAMAPGRLPTLMARSAVLVAVRIGVTVPATPGLTT